MGSTNKKSSKEISCKGRRSLPQTPSAPGFDLDFLGLEVGISSNDDTGAQSYPLHQAEENEANAELELFDQIAQRCLHLIDQHTEAVLQVVFQSV